MSLLRRSAILVALVMLLLSGCGGSRRATPTPTKTPSPISVAEANTPTPSPPTNTPPPAATPTPLSDATPSDTPTALPPTEEPTEVPTATPTPVLVARPANVNPLTGLTVDDPATLQRRPLFVVINNDREARSVHYGLAEAELVYEYLMEGRAVTRYTAVYLAQESERIGPMRSARLINWYLTPQYGGALAASGAGGDVNWWLTHKMDAPYLSIDLNDPSNTLYSWSLGADWRTRMQTSTELLRNWLADWDAESDPELQGFTFSPAPPDGLPWQTITIDFPALVVWSYDAAGGRYLRSMDGEPHLDAASGEQLSADNVIIQTMPHEPTEYVEDSLGTTSIRIISVGEGDVIILRDGLGVEGTWRASETTMAEFLDAEGHAIPLKPGNTWIEVVEPTVAVTLE